MKASEIEGLLPAVFQQTLHEKSPLLALLEAMEAQHAPSERALDRLHENFDPERTSAAMLGFLATWLDLERFGPEAGTEAPRYPRPAEILSLRALVGGASTLSRWRGTAVGLIHCLELATGVYGFRIEPDRDEVGGAPRPFSMVVIAPPSARGDAALIRRIISQEKPAHVRCRLDWDDVPELAEESTD